MSRLHAGHRSLAASFVTMGLVYGVWYAYSLFFPSAPPQHAVEPGRRHPGAVDATGSCVYITLDSVP